MGARRTASKAGGVSREQLLAYVKKLKVQLKTKTDEADSAAKAAATAEAAVAALGGRGELLDAAKARARAERNRRTSPGRARRFRLPAAFRKARISSITRRNGRLVSSLSPSSPQAQTAEQRARADAAETTAAQLNSMLSAAGEREVEFRAAFAQ